MLANNLEETVRQLKQFVPVFPTASSSSSSSTHPTLKLIVDLLPPADPLQSIPESELHIPDVGENVYKAWKSWLDSTKEVNHKRIKHVYTDFLYPAHHVKQRCFSDSNIRAQWTSVHIAKDESKSESQADDPSMCLIPNPLISLLPSAWFGSIRVESEEEVAPLPHLIKPSWAVRCIQIDHEFPSRPGCVLQLTELQHLRLSQQTLTMAEEVGGPIYKASVMWPLNDYSHGSAHAKISNGHLNQVDPSLENRLGGGLLFLLDLCFPKHIGGPNITDPSKEMND